MKKSILLSYFPGSVFSPSSIQSKLAGWWKEEKDNYIVDQLGSQEREILTQNSQAGQLFTGRAKQFAGATKRAVVDDQGAYDIGTASAFSLSFWIKWDSFTGFSRILGKIVNASTEGEYYFSTGSNSFIFNVRGSGGAQSVSLITGGVATGTWFHIIATIDASQVVRCYVNNVATGATPTVTGTISGIATTHGFGLNTTVTTVIGTGTGYGGTTQFRDLRIFKGKVLSSAERKDVYDGKWIADATAWFPLSDSHATRLHNAIGTSGPHFVATDCAQISNGLWRQVYNRYGYAEDATYGQIPADLSDLTTIDDVPTTDCYGNALVFYGTAKQNLIKSGSDLVFYNGSSSNQLDELIRSARLVGIDTWLSGDTPQALAASGIAPYSGRRQFYNATTKELIIIKRDQHLTQTEHTQLLSYMGISSTSHSYHANTTSLLARFTNTYGDIEKSHIDNLMRCLVRSGVYTKLEGFVYAALSGGSEAEDDESRLDWINASYNLVDAGNGNVTYVPMRGVAAQQGCYKNGFVTNTGSKFLQNDCFHSFKVAQNFALPGTYSVFGSDNVGVSAVTAAFRYGQTQNTQREISFRLNSNGTENILLPSDVETNRTFVMNRTGASAENVYAKYQLIGSGTVASVSRNSIEWFVGDRKTTANNISHRNWIQHMAWGAALSATESLHFTDIMDNHADDQLAFAQEYIQDTGFKYKLSDKNFIDVNGQQVVWFDFANLYYSTDLGTTVAASIAFDCTTLGWPHVAHIFDNGTIVIGTSKNKFYKTTTAMSSIPELSKTKGGSAYTIHTPSNSLYPGEYTKYLGIKKKMYLESGKEILVFNNYGTSVRGPSPGLVWYMVEDFTEIKVAFEFGQNPYLTDTGTPNGGTGGTPLGDASVTEWVRHGHGVQQRPDDLTKFISMWGDLDRAALSPIPGAYEECQGWEHIYDEDLDTWTESKLWTSADDERGKSTAAMMPGDGYVYLTSDAGIVGGNEAERGYFKVAYADIGTLSNWTRFYNPIQARPSNMFHLDGDGFFMGGGYASGGAGGAGWFGDPNIIWSDDMINFNEVRLKVPGNVYIPVIWKVSTKKYIMTMMSDYDYHFNAGCLVIDFN